MRMWSVRVGCEVDDDIPDERALPERISLPVVKYRNNEEHWKKYKNPTIRYIRTQATKVKSTCTAVIRNKTVTPATDKDKECT